MQFSVSFFFAVLFLDNKNSTSIQFKKKKKKKKKTVKSLLIQSPRIHMNRFPPTTGTPKRLKSRVKEKQSSPSLAQISILVTRLARRLLAQKEQRTRGRAFPLIAPYVRGAAEYVCGSCAGFEARARNDRFYCAVPRAYLPQPSRGLCFYDFPGQTRRLIGKSLTRELARACKGI